MPSHAKLIDKIILVGFRATGKSTLGPLLAKQLGWRYVELDAQIVAKAKCEISKLTQNGQNWQPFRKLELVELREVLTHRKVVIATGGGVGVNQVFDPVSKQTYGNLETKLIQAQPDLGVVLCAADSKIITKRIYDAEMLQNQSVRPVLNEKLAKQLATQLSDVDIKQVDQDKLRAITVVQDARATLAARQPLYEKISTFVVDTTDNSPENCTQKILTHFNLSV